MASIRRLAAILAADVAGYSRLMGTDEEGTHERLKAYRCELVEPKIGEHSGRIVKTTGDGMRRAGFLCCGGPRRRPARSVRSPETRR
jgi:class 3 adenylate cyclase